MAHDGVLERIVPGEQGGEGLLQRHLAGYAFVAQQVKDASLILDCGCGTGYGTHILATHCGPAIGLDRDADVLAGYARQTYPAALGYICGDALQLPFVEGCFDVAVVSQVLEHFHEPDVVVSEISRVCRPGARAFFMVPNALTQAPGEHLSSKYHALEFDPDTLQAVLRRHFAEVSMFGTFPGPLMARREQTDTWARRTVADDRLGLRRLVPRSLRQWLLRRFRGAQPDHEAVALGGDLLPRYNPDYYDISPGNVPQAVDLVAICQR